MFLFGKKKAVMPRPEEALPGRVEPIPGVPEHHFVNGNRIKPPFP